MTDRQTTTARKHIKKAAPAAKRKRAIAHLPKKTLTALGKEGRKGGKKEIGIEHPSTKVQYR